MQFSTVIIAISTIYTSNIYPYNANDFIANSFIENTVIPGTASGTSTTVTYLTSTKGIIPFYNTPSDSVFS
jgi:hypothetical protein